MNKNFDINIKSAIDRIEGYYEVSNFCFFDKIYPFTTENIANYIDLFELEGKSLLTVGSSGDQVINSILKGCTDITLVDINRYTKYYYYLKVASILELDINEYMNFLRYVDYPEFCKNNKDVFNKDVFNKIKVILRLLDYESYLFWDELFMTYKPLKIRNKLFYRDENISYVIVKCNPYLNSESSYNEVKNKLRNVKPLFINDDLFKVRLNRKYDNIWLSNIACYLDIDDVVVLAEKMRMYLNCEGNLLLSYLYGIDNHFEYSNVFVSVYNLGNVFKIFESYNLLLCSFNSISDYNRDKNIYKSNNYTGKDAVLVYKKRL